MYSKTKLRAYRFAFRYDAELVLFWLFLAVVAIVAGCLLPGER